MTIREKQPRTFPVILCMAKIFLGQNEVIRITYGRFATRIYLKESTYSGLSSTMLVSSPTLLYFIALLGYLVLLAGVGFAFSRLSRNTTDYFRNGSQTSWWVAGASVFMNMFSAFTFTGAAGVAFHAGWSAAASFYGGGLALLVCAFFLGAWFRQMRVTTFPQALSARYGEGTRLTFAAITVLTQTAYAALWLYSLSLFVSVVFQFPLGPTILILGFSVTLYTTVGGSWAATAGDFIQAALLIPVTTLLAFLCLQHFGGVGGFFEAVSAKGLDADFAFLKGNDAFEGGAYSWVWTIAIMLVTFISGTSTMSGVRYFAVKDGNHARWASWLALILLLFGVAVWFIPPMTGRLLYSDLILAQDLAHPADAAYAITGLQMLPAAVAALLLLGMFSATISSLDTGLNRNVAIVICDLYPAACKRFGWRERSQRELLLPSRILAFLTGMTLIGLASYMASLEGVGILEIMIRVGAMLAIPMAVPLLLCLFTRRVPSWSAVLSVLSGFVCGLLCAHNELSVQATTLWTTTVSTLAFLGSALYPRSRQSPEYVEKVERFFTQMKTPVIYREEVGETADRSQFIILGIALICLGLLAGGIALVSRESLWLSGGVCTFYFLLGGGLTVIGWRSKDSGREPPLNKAS